MPGLEAYAPGAGHVDEMKSQREQERPLKAKRRMTERKQLKPLGGAGAGLHGHEDNYRWALKEAKRYIQSRTSKFDAEEYRDVILTIDIALNKNRG